MSINILVIDDEPGICQLLAATLQQHDYHVTIANNAKQALSQLNHKAPDIVILDLGLPDMDGQELLRVLRQWSHIPIVILSARHDEQEKVTALNNGADDYLSKPFGQAELLARLRNALRHAARIAGSGDSHYRYHELVIDLEKRLVQLRGEKLHLTPTEYRLLAALAKEAGKVVTQAQLINAVWGKNRQGNSHYLRIYVQHLRAKLQDDPLQPIYIITEPGVGYRLMSA